MEDKNKSKKAKKVETLVFKSSENGAFSDPFLDFFRHFWWALLQTSSSSSLLLRLPCVFTDSLFSSVICLRVDSKPPPTKFLSLSLPPLPACFYPLGFEDSEPKIVDSPKMKMKMKMKMSAGKDDGLPDRNSVDSVLKLFGRNIPISISQDLTIPKRGKSSDSREAAEYRPLDAKREEKNLKKPEKIVPCPRCDSYDTKFCYFNNYNVNQPRHFCKNCHRYWTAGGTVRNVPVGASRRRNKHLASQFCHVNATQIEGSDSANHPPTSNVISNTNLLTLGLEKLLPKSMDPPLDEPSTNGSSISTASNTMTEFSKTEGIASSRPRASEQCYLIPPGWDWNSIPAIQWNPPATDAYVVNSTWQCENGNGSGSGILGKHCREVQLVEEGRTETSVLVPKTLRVDDPKEASKSPIWGSLGFKPYSLETKL